MILPYNFLLLALVHMILSTASIHLRDFKRIARETRRLAYYVDVGVNDKGVYQAAEMIRQGKLVAFPTETVYGLGANALNNESVKRIFQAKQRPATDPLIVHICKKDQMSELFSFNSSSMAEAVCNILADSFWPGPLTLVHKSSASVPDSVTAGTGYVGIRYPRHPIAQKLISLARVPIAAPSANRFGHVSPTTSKHVMDDLYSEDIAILREEEMKLCDIGIESTVCQVSDDGMSVSILRCGAITLSDMNDAFNKRGLNVVTLIKPKDKQPIVAVEPAVAPGQMLKHYAPDVPTYILRSTITLELFYKGREDVYEVMVNRDDTHLYKTELNLRDAFIIDFHGRLVKLKPFVGNYIDLSVVGDIEEAYQLLFDSLRESERSDAERQSKFVLLPDLQEDAKQDEKIAALWERLYRAASGEFI